MCKSSWFAILSLCLCLSVNVSGQNFNFCVDCAGIFGNCDLPPVEDNPELTALCSEMDIILIIDESTSILGFEDDVEEGVLDFVSALVSTGVNMAVIEFDSTVQLVSDYNVVDDLFLSNMSGYFAGVPFNGQTYNVLPDQGTNWMAAMQAAVDLQPADLILFFTDGNPTVFTAQNGTQNTCGNGFTTQIPEIVNPMLIANYLKGTIGSHMFMMGVGTADSLRFNLERMSGMTEWNQGITEFQTADYALGNFETLAQELRSFAIEICGTGVDATLTPDADSICLGQTVQVTLQVTNNGIENPAKDVVVRDTFPAGFTNFQVISGNGACFGSGCDPDQPANVLVWNAGDIDTLASTTLIIEATAMTSGTFVNTAWLTAQNTAVISGTATFYVAPLLEVTIGVNQTFCAGEPTLLVATGSGGFGLYNYIWSTGESTDSITVAPVAPTTYSVTVTDRMGCLGTDEIEVTLEPPLEVDIPDVDTSCVGSDFVLNPGGNTSYTYQWSPVELLDDPNVPSPIATVLETTTFFVTITDGTCTVTDQIQIVVQALPDVQLPGPDTSCFGAQVVLNPGGSLEYTYQWSPPQFLNDPDIPNPIAQVSESTTFYVTITDHTAAQCSTVDSVYVFIPPDIDLGAPADSIYCDSLAIVLTATGIGLEYTWYTSLGQPIGTGPEITVQPQEETTYILEGRDSFGCEVQTTVTLTPTYFDYTPSNDQIICEGETAVLGIQNNSGQILTYLWTPQHGIVGPNNESTVNVMPDSTTTYTVLITDAALGCTAEESFEVVVSAFDPPILVINVDKDTIFLGQTYVLSTNQDPELFYFWDGPGIENPNLPVIMGMPPASGIYTYAVTITNSDGCRINGSISNLVTVNPLCNMEDVFVPDAFSPNDDGENDILQVYGNYISAMELRIFSRWGEQVFISTDQNNGWDGTFNGKELAPDVFGYYLRVECPPDKTYFTKGNITLFK